MPMKNLRYVVPECAACSDGCGPVLELSASERGKLLIVTLAINCVLEQETMCVSIWGSADAHNWGTAPLASFSPKNYCGVYSTVLNLAARPHVRYIRADWKMERWKRRTKEVMFDFCIAI